MATDADFLAPTAKRPRVHGLDRLRGLAVLLMVLDHAVLVAGLLGTDVPFVRDTLTRAAMPLFFLVAGVLVPTRITLARGQRLALLVAIGAGLPLVVPWIDNPNVLLWYVAGYLLVVFLRSRGWLWPSLTVVVLLSFGLLANGYSWRVGSGYDPVGLLGFMIFGAVLGTVVARWGDNLPGWVGRDGRFPLSVYVWHLLGLEAVRLLLA